MSEGGPKTTVEELLGPLNDVERKNASAKLYFAGDLGVFDVAARVSIVGSRRASSRGLKRHWIITIRRGIGPCRFGSWLSTLVLERLMNDRPLSWPAEVAHYGPFPLGPDQLEEISKYLLENGRTDVAHLHL